VFCDVSLHGDVNIYFLNLICIVPLQSDLAILTAIAVFSDCVVLLQGIDEVVNMPSSNAFHAKVIDNKGKANGVRDMFPNEGDAGYFIVSVWY